MAKAAVNAKTKPAPADKPRPEIVEKTRSKYYEYLINSWIFLPVLVYFKMINQYAVNLPGGDDYDAILKFLNSFKTSTSLYEKLGLLFQQHGEHRILSSRFIFLVYDTLAGGVNFINLIFIANLQLVVIFIVSVILIKKALPKYWNIASFLVGVCLFDMNGYDNADFAMCGMVNYGVIMLFLLSLLFYTCNKPKYIALAVFFQVVCIYSSGNGIVAAFMLVLFTFFTRDRMKIISCTAAFLIFAPLYYLHYTKADQSTYSKDPAKIIPFFFHMTGGHFGFENGIIAGVLLLVVFILVLPVSKKLKIKEHTLPFLCIIAFFLASNGVISIFRSNIKILDSYSSRYLINPNMLTAIAVVLIMIRMQTHKYKWPVIAGTSILLVYMYTLNYAYGEAGFARTQYRMQNQEYNYPPEHVGEARDIAIQSCKLGIYCIQDER